MRLDKRIVACSALALSTAFAGGHGGSSHIGNAQSVTNVALGKPATQSSTLSIYGPTRAVDGNLSGVLSDFSLSHTDLEAQAWWEVDLGASYSIATIHLHNRSDCCDDRLSNFHVLVSDAPFASQALTPTLSQPGVTDYAYPGIAGGETIITATRTARFVRVQLHSINYLQLAEVRVFGSSAPAASPTSTSTPTPASLLTPTSTPVDTPSPTRTHTPAPPGTPAPTVTPTSFGTPAAAAKTLRLPLVSRDYTNHSRCTALRVTPPFELSQAPSDPLNIYVFTATKATYTVTLANYSYPLTLTGTLLVYEADPPNCASATQPKLIAFTELEKNKPYAVVYNDVFIRNRPYYLVIFTRGGAGYSRYTLTME